MRRDQSFIPLQYTSVNPQRCCQLLAGHQPRSGAALGASIMLHSLKRVLFDVSGSGLRGQKSRPGWTACSRR